MARETSYFVQSFNAGKGGNLKADAPIPCKSATGAVRTAERLALSKLGVVAFSSTGDPEMGDYDDEPTVIFRNGQYSGSLRLISIPASEPRASNDRGGTGDQALTIAQANNEPPTSSLPRCDCNGSLISNDAELTGVKETFSGHPHSLVGWQL